MYARERRRVVGYPGERYLRDRNHVERGAYLHEHQILRLLGNAVLQRRTLSNPAFCSKASPPSELARVHVWVVADEGVYPGGRYAKPSYYSERKERRVFKKQAKTNEGKTESETAQRATADEMREGRRERRRGTDEDRYQLVDSLLGAPIAVRLTGLQF